MPVPIDPVMIVAIEDAFRVGKASSANAILEHIDMFMTVAAKLGGGAVPMQQQAMANPVQRQGPSPLEETIMRSSKSGAGPRRIILPSEESNLPQVLQQFWTVPDLLDACKKNLPQTIDFRAPGGEQLTLARTLRTIDPPAGDQEAGEAPIGSGGVQVMYALSGSPEGPTVMLWTSQEKVSADAIMQEIEAIANQVYRRRGPIPVTVPPVVPYRMDPNAAMFGGDVE